MSWLSAISLVLAYGPDLIAAIAVLVGAIRAMLTRLRSDNAKNPDFKGAVRALETIMTVAGEVIVNLRTRSDLSNVEKREQGFRDLQATLAGRYGIVIGETDAIRFMQEKYGEMK